MLYVWLFKLTGFLPLMLWFRPRVRGRENLPKEPCILALNHGAAMDPVLINAVFPVKRIYMLTAERLVLSQLFDSLPSPSSRGSLVPLRFRPLEWYHPLI